MNMPSRKTVLIGLGVLAAIVIIAWIVIAITRAPKASQSPAFQGPLPTPQVSEQVPVEPSAAQAPVKDPNDFSGDWYFIKMVAKQNEGILKGNDIGEFRSKVNGEVIFATCSAPRSPSPKGEDPATGYPGDLFRWDSSTNILYPVVDNSLGNIQRFWFPRRPAQ